MLSLEFVGFFNSVSFDVLIKLNEMGQERKQGTVYTMYVSVHDHEYILK